MNFLGLYFLHLLVDKIKSSPMIKAIDMQNMIGVLSLSIGFASLKLMIPNTS